MNVEAAIAIGFLFTATWGRHFLDMAIREVKIRRRHYR